MHFRAFWLFENYDQKVVNLFAMIQNVGIFLKINDKTVRKLTGKNVKHNIKKKTVNMV